ncbi:probable glycosidase CRH2 [Anopheles stephensi]|uniref:probable glycosidase CRH2 n=1 Tax=Anopheles stephensi TaxID=30069 RepID=UPI0016587DAA|nr:probable glycosidase CRH2 [Anopheles stephensi]XP_035918726.1 probable glycosidase CRH2 [Anopheles stephensi]
MGRLSDLSTHLKELWTTPNAQLEDRKTPAEKMFGRVLRTSFELLRPPTKMPQQSAERARSFEPNDMVYAKVYRRNTWIWVPAVVVKRCGSVMYLVKSDNQRVFRSHVNQLRRRVIARDRGLVDSDHRLPLDVLLDSWSLSSSSSPSVSSSSSSSSPSVSSSSSSSSSSTSLSSSSSSPSSLSSSSLSPSSSSTSPSSSASSSSSSPSSSSSSSSSSPSSSATWISANSSSSQTVPLQTASKIPLQQQTISSPPPAECQRSGDHQEAEPVPPPRRSSRIRRVPRWFNGYQLS